MVSKRVGLITPLALSSVEMEFHESYMANITYLQMHVDKLPFKLKELKRITPKTVNIAENRNESIAWAKKFDCDYTVWFDADQDFRNYGSGEMQPDILFRLLKDGFNYPLYAGIYYLKKPPFHPIVFQADKSFKEFRPIWRFPKDKLFYADMIGMGCVKIDLEILNQLDPPYFKYGVLPKSLAGLGSYARFKYENGIKDVSEDVAFWRQVQRKTGERIVIDPQIQVGHIVKNMVTPQVFEMQLEESLKAIKAEKPKDEFEKWWQEVREAEVLDEQGCKGKKIAPKHRSCG